MMLKENIFDIFKVWAFTFAGVATAQYPELSGSEQTAVQAMSIVLDIMSILAVSAAFGYTVWKWRRDKRKEDAR